MCVLMGMVHMDRLIHLMFSNLHSGTPDLEDGSDSLGRWEVSAPVGIVEGSDRGWVTVVGSLLSVSLEVSDLNYHRANWESINHTKLTYCIYIVTYWMY